MCLAKVEINGEEKNERQDKLEDIAWIERTDEDLKVVDFFGKVTQLQAEIRSIDFVDSIVHFERHKIRSETA